MVTTTLDQMAEGGIYDHVGGGFHRYSTDAQWLVPHFEKMLYDNAQLAVLYTRGVAAGTRDPGYRARRARDPRLRPPRDDGGRRSGFYSATDADSPDAERTRRRGLVLHLDARPSSKPLLDAAGCRSRFVRVRSHERAATSRAATSFIAPRPIERSRPSSRDVTAKQVKKVLEEARTTLYDARASRPATAFATTRVITAWNGMMISAFAQVAWVVVRRGSIRQVAASKGGQVHSSTNMRDESWRPRTHLSRTVSKSDTVVPRRLRARWSAACLDLYETTGFLRLDGGRARAATRRRTHASPTRMHGGYFLTPSDGELPCWCARSLHTTSAVPSAELGGCEQPSSVSTT